MLSSIAQAIKTVRGILDPKELLDILADKSDEILEIVKRIEATVGRIETMQNAMVYGHIGAAKTELQDSFSDELSVQEKLEHIAHARRELQYAFHVLEKIPEARANVIEIAFLIAYCRMLEGKPNLAQEWINKAIPFYRGMQQDVEKHLNHLTSERKACRVGGGFAFVVGALLFIPTGGASSVFMLSGGALLVLSKDEEIKRHYDVVVEFDQDVQELKLLAQSLN
ncbi:MAG: hypothetical protein EAY65_01215 [Alphaproteobacteria bacterium]|nr:MAG: hypothetical protein EAY65_01215 [Alphaproteobacteria bacterium]